MSKKWIDTISVLIALAIILTQPIHAAVVIGDFGKVDALQEQGQIIADASYNYSISGANSKAGGIVEIPDFIKSEINTSQGENTTNLDVFEEDLGNGVYVVGVGHGASKQDNTSSDANISSQLYLSDWKFAKEISGQSENYEPKRVTTVFSKNDYASYIWSRFNSVYESHKVNWKWYDPNGNFYTEAGHTIPNPRDYGWEYWDWYKTGGGIYIKNNVPASKPGLWNAKTYLDNDKIIDANFVVKYQYAQSKMVKGVDGDGNPGQETNEFYASDHAAYTWFKLNNVADPLDVKFEWYDPDGKLYSTTLLNVPDQGTDKFWEWYNLWSWIYIKGYFPENKCGTWNVKAYIDNQLLYSKDFVIKNCAPPQKCSPQSQEAWVEKDGEAFNNIKTWHKFENKAGETLNYDINFELFDANGLKVAWTTSKGDLKAGWYTSWWVQYGVPNGGWKPGNYVSRATISGTCSTQNVNLANEAYPLINAPTPVPGVPDTNYCDGKIKAKVIDKYNNRLQGVKIFLDGSIEGTTFSDGTREITIADNACNIQHKIKATCPNDAHCDEKTSSISYDGDSNNVNFICNCPGLIPGLDVKATTDSYKYARNSDVKMNINVRDDIGNLAKNPFLSLYDPFFGASKFFNLDEGLLSYSSKAISSGLQSFFLSAYKQGFLPGSSKVKVVVEDNSAAINVQALSLDGSPLQSALIFLDGQFKGVTNSAGSNLITGEKGKTITLALKCPAAGANDNFCGAKQFIAKENNFVSVKCDCGKKATTSNLRIRLKAAPQGYERGYPMGNVDILIDENYKGTSNQFGTVDIENLALGEHKIDVYLKVIEDGQEKFYTGGTKLSLSDEYEEKIFKIIKGASPKILSVTDNDQNAFILQEHNASEQIIPLIVAAIYVGMIAWDAYDYWQCLDNSAKDWEPYKNNWDNYQCNPPLPANPDKYNDCVDKSLSKNQNQADNCLFEMTMLAANFIPGEAIGKLPIKLAVKFGKGAKKVSRFIPYIDDAVEGAYRTKTEIKNSKTYIRVYDNLAKGSEYVFEVVDNGFKIVDNVVGLMVNKISKNPENWNKITNKLNLMLATVKKSDIPTSKSSSISNIQGVLGEKASFEYVDIIKLSLEKEGTQVIVKKGSVGSELIEFTNPKYKAVYTETGRGIRIIDKVTKQDITEIDGLLFINNKPIILEAKASQANNIADDLIADDFLRKKINTIESLTGQKPEVLLLIPKGEASKSITGFPTLVNKLDSFGKSLKDKGVNFAYEEFPIDSFTFNKVAREINNGVR